LPISLQRVSELMTTLTLKLIQASAWPARI
jgi:hypothetical protein